jgi:hypothetical protein
MMFRWIPIIVLYTACASFVPKDLEPPKRRSAQVEGASYLKTARALEQAGAHLEASVYFESALVAGCDEQIVLPHLISTQVRSGRLRAAKKSVARFISLDGESTWAREMERLLEQFVPVQQNVQVSQ